MRVDPMDSELEGGFVSPCACERCGRLVEDEELWPHPQDRFWIGKVDAALFCDSCYELIGNQVGGSK